VPKEVVAPDQAWIALPLHQCVDLRRPLDCRLAPLKARCSGAGLSLECQAR